MSALLPVYRRSKLVIARGEGCTLFGVDGARYLDFAAGIAVNALGHGHPHVVQALKTQADLLWHCSNMYHTPGLDRFAARLVEATFADKIFFCNSGGEAVEAGIKMVRKYHDYVGNPDKFRIITMKNGFHGRSLTCISAGGNEAARAGYYPLMEGFDAVPLNNIEAVKAAITPETAGILIEPIQGEGGIIEATTEFLQGLQRLCDAQGLLLFCDEVQSGMGRTGQMFAYEIAGITPDIVSVAKGIGNGFPLAAMLTTDKVAACMTPGAHGSTYGANPLAMAVGNAVLDVLQQPDFMNHVKRVGMELKVALEGLAKQYPHLIEEVRGRGLMLGLQMKIDHFVFVDKLRAAGLLTSPAYGGVIRFVPPLIIETSHVQEALAILARVCEEWK